MARIRLLLALLNIVRVRGILHSNSVVAAESSTRRMEGQALPCSPCPDGGVLDLSPGLCTDLANQILFYNEFDTECLDYQTQAAEFCCNGNRSPPPQIRDACNLCAEGGEPDLMSVAYGTTTCNDLASRGLVISNTTRQCYLLQLQGARFCGCPSDQLRKCNLCSGDQGDAFNFPDNRVNMDGRELACKELHESIAESDNDCPTVQAHGFFNCGCPGLPQVTTECSLCYNKEDAFVDLPFNEEEFGTNYRCSDKLVDIFAAKEDECTKGQAEAALRCGCQSQPPPPEEPHCTLCPGGLDPISGDKAVPGFGPQMTCQAFSDIVPLLYDGRNCATLETYRNLCECPTEAKCRLCNFGEEVTDASKIVEGPTQQLTCQEVDNAAQFIRLGSSISAFQEQCQNYRNEFASSCCPDSMIEPLVFDFPSAAPSPPPVTAAIGVSAASTVSTSLSILVCLFWMVQ